MQSHRDRVIAMRQRHADAVRELASAGITPNAIYFDPDYHSGELRQTLAAIVESFPHTLLVGHDWFWHAVQREVSRITRQTGRRLASRGNLWQLAPARRHARVRATAASSNNGAARSRNRPRRVLVTMPHFFLEHSSRLYASGTDSRQRRASAVRACLTSLHQTLGAQSYTANLARPENLVADAMTQAELHVVVCVHAGDHVLDDLGLPPTWYQPRQIDGDPLFLGYACHETLRDRLGEFDEYVYLEDDLVLTDP